MFNRSFNQKAKRAGPRGRVTAPAQTSAALPGAAVGRMLVGRHWVQPGRNPGHEQLEPVAVTCRLNHQSKRNRLNLKLYATRSQRESSFWRHQLARIWKHNAVFLSESAWELLIVVEGWSGIHVVQSHPMNLISKHSQKKKRIVLSF